MRCRWPGGVRGWIAVAILGVVGCGAGATEPPRSQPAAPSGAAATPGGDAQRGEGIAKSEELPPQVSADCDRMVAAINDSVKRIKDTPVDGDVGQLPMQFRHFSEVARQEAEKLRAIGVDTSELARMVADYATMAVEVASAASDLADVLDDLAAVAEAADDPERLAKLKAIEVRGDGAQAKLDAATSKEDPLVDEINAFCKVGDSRPAAPTAPGLR